MREAFEGHVHPKMYAQSTITTTRDCGGELAALSEAIILAKQSLKVKRLDISGNPSSEEAVSTLISILEGRSHTKAVTPFWLAIGDGFDALLSPATNCDPHSGTGCRCRDKRVVHVVRSFEQPAAVKAMKTLPPPPLEPPPQPPIYVAATAAQ